MLFRTKPASPEEHCYSFRDNQGYVNRRGKVEAQLRWLHGQSARSRKRWRSLYKQQLLYFARYLLHLRLASMSLTASIRTPLFAYTPILQRTISSRSGLYRSDCHLG